MSKARKSGGSLPVPMHQRTVSSPVPLIETTSPDALPISHKRYPSSVDQRVIDTTDRLSFKHDSKKLSLDSHLSVEKSPKRTSSDTSDKHSKKNFSNEKLTAKRSLDEIRMPTTTLDNKFVLNTPETPKSMTASPELLAELLKGSSEKLLNEQNHNKKHQNRNSNHNSNGMSLPAAVLKSLNSLVSLISFLLHFEHISTIPQNRTRFISSVKLKSTKMFYTLLERPIRQTSSDDFVHFDSTTSAMKSFYSNKYNFSSPLILPHKCLLFHFKQNFPAKLLTFVVIWR